MKTGFAAITLGIAAMIAVPAAAGDKWDKNTKREYREDRRQQEQAYREGYRDALRSDGRRGPQAWQPYSNGSRWDASRNRWERDTREYRDRQYRGDARYGYDDNGYYRDGYDRSGNRYPVYRGTNYSQANAPYWWGSNGRVNCRRQDGTAGLIVGAIAGGTLGNVIAGQGDRRLGSVIGGTLGAVLGNEIAKGTARCR